NFTDPASYLLAVSYNTTAQINSAQSIFLPASLCPQSSASLQSGCPIMIAAASPSSNFVYLRVLPMSSAGLSWLQPAQPLSGLTPPLGAAYYQLSMPASPSMVTVTVTSADSVSVFCSYRFIRPTLTFNDWGFTNSSALSTSGDRQ